MIIEQLESRRMFSSLAGDANNDHRVDAADYVILALHFGSAGGSPAVGDFNFDARVNGLDFNILASNFGAIEMATNWTGGGGDGDFQNSDNWTNGVASLANVGTFPSGQTDLNNVPATAFSVVAGTEAVINFNGATLNAGTVLSSSGGGTIIDFTQLRTSGQQAKYATVTGGVEQSRAVGSTYTVSYAAAYAAFGFVPDGFSSDDIPFADTTIDTVAKTVTATIPVGATVSSGLAIALYADVALLNIDTITVTAAPTWLATGDSDKMLRAANWGGGAVPGPSDLAIINTLTSDLIGPYDVTSDSVTNPHTIGSIDFQDGQDDSGDGNYEWPGITCAGQLTLGSGISYLTLESAGSVSGQCNSLIFNNLTGAVSQSNATGDVLEIVEHTSSAILILDNLDRDGSTQIDTAFKGTLHIADGEIHTLNGQSLAPGAIISGNGGLQSYIWQGPNAGASMTQTSAAAGSTVSGHYDARFGFRPTTLVINDKNTAVTVSGGGTASETWSALVDPTTPAQLYEQGNVQLVDGANLIEIDLATLNVTAAAGSAAKSSMNAAVKQCLGLC